MATVSAYPQPPPRPPPKKNHLSEAPSPQKFKIWTPKNGPSLRISESIRVPSPSPMRYWWLSFGWHHEVMNHIFDSTEESYTIRHLTDRVCSVNVERTLCPLNIQYIFTLSVIHPFLIRQSPLVDHSLSATCPLNMRYSCVLWAPHTLREDTHRHRDDFHHWMNNG